MTVEHFSFPGGLRITLDSTYNDPVELAQRRGIKGEILPAGDMRSIYRGERTIHIIAAKNGEAFISDTSPRNNSLTNQLDGVSSEAESDTEVTTTAVLNEDLPTYVVDISHFDLSWTITDIFRYKPGEAPKSTPPMLQ